MDIQQILLAKKREIEAKLSAKNAGQSHVLPPATIPPPALVSNSFLPPGPTQAVVPPLQFKIGAQGRQSIKEERPSLRTEDVQDQLYNHLMEAMREYRFLLETSSTGSTVKTEPPEASSYPPDIDARPTFSMKREADADELPRPEKKRRSRWGEQPEKAAQTSTNSFLPDSKLDIRPDIKYEAASSSLACIDPQAALQLAQLKQQLAQKESMLKKVGGKVAPIDVADATGQPFREHEMRRLEMEKTKEQAAKQTVPLFQGKHHMQDFLPPEELAKFVRKPGQSLAPSTSKEQYEENKLGESNFGYQMLQKFGWTEGAGLGLGSSGITAPIANVGTTERTGLGNKKPNEVEEDDDEFELYRKRMMTAYKHRPNPLNNPRRPYY